MVHLGVILKIVFVLLKRFFKWTDEQKKAKDEAVKEILDASKKKDPSAITAGFDKLNRL